jgi:hypothetical protein
MLYNLLILYVCVYTCLNMRTLCRKLEPWEKFCVHMDRALETMARLVRENRGGLVGDLLRYPSTATHHKQSQSIAVHFSLDKSFLRLSCRKNT